MNWPNGLTRLWLTCTPETSCASGGTSASRPASTAEKAETADARPATSKEARKRIGFGTSLYFTRTSRQEFPSGRESGGKRGRLSEFGRDTPLAILKLTIPLPA